MLRMKMFAALGHPDIVAAHRAQIQGQTISFETSYIYSGQLLEYCREQNIETLALSFNSRADSVRDGPLLIENRPRLLKGRGPIAYHLSCTGYGLYVAYCARRFGADLAVISSNGVHHFALAAFRLVGIPVVIDFHNVLWPVGYKPDKWSASVIRALDAWFFRWVAAAVTGVSPECGRQARELAGHALPFFDYRAQFRRDEFRSATRDHGRQPFRIMFVGRAERNKGVLDIAAIARQVRERSKIPVMFDVCGDGSALNGLRQAIEKKRLDDIVHLHGQLERPELLKLYAEAHAVIVPTRGDFCEGLPKVCAEAVLFGLPIITSRLSNALEVLGPAIVEAQPENIESYVAAILKLVEDRALYERLSAACPALSRQFFDRSQGMPGALDRVMSHLFPGWRLLDDYAPIFTRMK
jgi:glycosyltransferase involved in cell wall biosynthesis